MPIYSYKLEYHPISKKYFLIRKDGFERIIYIGPDPVGVLNKLKLIIKDNIKNIIIDKSVIQEISFNAIRKDLESLVHQYSIPLLT